MNVVFKFFSLLFVWHLCFVNSAISQGHVDNTDPFEQLEPKSEEVAVKIVVLNKVTAKTQEIEASLDKKFIVENLEITILKCIKDADPYSENQYVFLKVIEKKVTEDTKIIFEGWIVTGNAAVSSIEHPVYEIFATH